MKLSQLFPYTFKNLGLYMPPRPMWSYRLSAKSSFCQAVLSNHILTHRQMVHAALRYRLGCTSSGAVVYWQIDQLGQEHDGKLMWYDADCHRDKSRHATWISFLMKQHFGMPQNSFQPQHVLFGLHLLAQRPDDVVCIVEAEKTAVVLSEIYPQYVWMAAGGMFELQPQKFLPLSRNSVVLIPDTDEDVKAYGVWYRTAQQVMNSFLWPRRNRIYVSDFLERHATPDQKRRKIDLLDYVLESTEKINYLY